MADGLEREKGKPGVRIGFIVGGVVDEGGNPLEGVRITTNDSAGYSNQKGEFIIGDRPELNPHQLMAYLEGYRVETQMLKLEPGMMQDVRVRLTSISCCISGVVTDDVTHQPIAGANVCLGSTNCVLTAADGSYRLCDQPGYYTLTATAERYRTYNNSGTQVKIPRQTDKNFTMKPKLM